MHDRHPQRLKNGGPDVRVEHVHINEDGQELIGIVRREEAQLGINGGVAQFPAILEPMGGKPVQLVTSNEWSSTMRRFAALAFSLGFDVSRSRPIVK